MRRGLVITGSVFLTIGLLLLLFFLLFYAFQLLPHGAGDEQREQHRAVMEYLIVPIYAPQTLGFLTAAERSHMDDVKRLFNWAFILCVLFLASFRLMRQFEEEELMRASRNTSYALFGLLLVSVLTSIVLGFEGLWRLFHRLFFPMGNWRFAADSTLITLYPGSFFFWYVAAYGLLILFAAFFLFYTSDLNAKRAPEVE